MVDIKKTDIDNDNKLLDYQSDEDDDNECDDEGEDDEDFDYYSEDNNSLYCQSCELVFYSPELLESHKAQHRICGIDGCTFEAHRNIIEKHIQNQHLTGLYEKIRKLNTTEDIQKWIEERRMNHPSNKGNMKKRKAAEEEKNARGERLVEKKDCFNRKKTKMVKIIPKRTPKRNNKCISSTVEKESQIDEKCDWNGKMFPFKGTKQLYNQEVNMIIDSDDEDYNLLLENNDEIPKNQSGLATILGAYSFSDDDELKEDSAPVEEKIQREPVIDIPEATVESNTSNVMSKEISNNHKRKRRKVVQNNANNNNDNKNIVDGFSNIKFASRKQTLLEKLLQNEIRHERNVLLQCVRYVVRENFFLDKS